MSKLLETHPRHLAVAALLAGVIAGHGLLLSILPRVTALSADAGRGAAVRAAQPAQVRVRSVAARGPAPVAQPRPDTPTAALSRVEASARRAQATSARRPVHADPAGPSRDPTAPANAAASTSDPAEAGAARLPIYATRLPAAASLHYTLHKGAAIGSAVLRWDRGRASAPAADPDRYALALESSLPGRPALAWVSAGAIDAQGVAPERYAERLRGREQRAANFRRDSGRITFSGPRIELPLLPGAQDRLSWLLQLAGVLAADPTLAAPGRQVTLYVAGARGEGRPWVFVVVGNEDLDLPSGLAHALLLRREPDRPYDTRAEVWLDPARQHLPVRVRWQSPPAPETTELVLQAIDRP